MTKKVVLFLMQLSVLCFADSTQDRRQEYGMQLQTAMEQIVTEYSIPGFPAGLLFARLDHEKVHTYITGEIRADNALRIASLTKMFVSYLVLDQIELGLWRTLDNWYDPVRYPSSDKITLRMLLSHTSGVPDYLAYVDLSAYLTKDVIIDNAWNPTLGLDFEPGSTWCYSNTGYIILADILERTTGRTIAELWEKAYGKKAPSFYVDDGRPNAFPTSYFNPWPLHWSAPWVAGGGIAQAAELLQVFDNLTNKNEFRTMQQWTTAPRCASDVVFGDRYGLGLQYYDLGSLGVGLGHDGDIICRSVLLKIGKTCYFLHVTWPVDNNTLKAILLRLLAEG